MNPEEFDRIFRSKLDQLEQVPGLEWNDNSVWQKIKKHPGAYTKGIFLTTGIMLLVGITWLILKPSVRQPSHITPVVTSSKKGGEVQRLTQMATEEQEHRSAVKILKSSVKAKEKLQTQDEMPEADEIVSKALVMNPDTTLILEENDSLNTLWEAKTIDQKLAFTGLVKRDTVLSTAKKPIFQTQEREEEVYFSTSSGGITSGTRQVQPISRRFSLVYGLQLSHTYNPYFNRESDQSVMSSDFTWQIPVELRYYLLPKEKRFTAFLYAGLLGSIPTGKGMPGNNSALHFESGAEARYRISPADKKSKAYLFVRMPFYRQSILNYKYQASPSNENLLWYGNTIRWSLPN